KVIKVAVRITFDIKIHRASGSLDNRRSDNVNLLFRIASACIAYSCLRGLSGGRLRGRKVYESWVTVKIPLSCCRFCSFSPMFESKERSSFSKAIWRHRYWYSHSRQCLLRIKGGGAGPC